MKEDREPTEEEIRLGLRLPNPKTIQEFVEPIKRWQEVKGSGVPSWKKELLPEEEAERGEGCVTPLKARRERSLLGFLREFENEAPPPTRLQSQPSGVTNTPAGAEDPDPPAREEAPNQVEDQNMIGGPGEETQGLHDTHHQPAEAQAERQTRGARAWIQKPPPGQGKKGIGPASTQRQS